MTEQPTWLDVVLHDLSDEDSAQALRRATTAATKRLVARYAKYLDKAESVEEFRQRLAFIDPGIRQTAAEAAVDYGFEDSLDIYEAGLKVLAERGAVLDRKPKHVDPDSAIGDVPSSGVIDMPGNRTPSYDDIVGPSKWHPHEMQDITKDEDLKNNDGGLEAIKVRSDEIDAQSPIGPELTGAGGTFPKGNQATPVTSSAWRVLD